MGDRKCQFAGCRSLTFRSTDYCWKHQEGKPHEKTRYSENSEKARPEPITITDPLLIPMIVLGFVVLVSSIGGWTLLVESAVCGLLFLPLYAVYLVLWTWKRFKDGTLTWFDAIFHIVSFIVLLGFCVLALAVAGMGSPA